MDKITDYMIVEADTVTDLPKKVKALLKNGWEPLGGPLLCNCASGAILIQPMVIYKRGGPS